MKLLKDQFPVFFCSKYHREIIIREITLILCISLQNEGEVNLSLGRFAIEELFRLPEKQTKNKRQLSCQL
jgi:hypothetical protein